jgi:hypothetical protein
MIFHQYANDKKSNERLKDTFVIVVGQGNKSGELFYLELRNSKLKFTKARSDAAD